MKYRIGNTVINSDHIARVDYFPAHGTNRSCCNISMIPKSSDDIVLSDDEADRFWEVYSGDSYRVV